MGKVEHVLVQFEQKKKKYTTWNRKDTWAVQLLEI